MVKVGDVDFGSILPTPKNKEKSDLQFGGFFIFLAVQVFVAWAAGLFASGVFTVPVLIAALFIVGTAWVAAGLIDRILAPPGVKDRALNTIGQLSQEYESLTRADSDAPATEVHEQRLRIQDASDLLQAGVDLLDQRRWSEQRLEEALSSVLPLTEEIALGRVKTRRRLLAESRQDPLKLAERRLEQQEEEVGRLRRQRIQELRHRDREQIERAQEHAKRLMKGDPESQSMYAQIEEELRRPLPSARPGSDKPPTQRRSPNKIQPDQ